MYTRLRLLLGETRIGLLETCLTIPNRNTTCYLPEDIRAEWLFTFLCIVVGVVCITVTVILLAASYWNPRVTRVARWLGLAASEFLFYTYHLYYT